MFNIGKYDIFELANRCVARCDSPAKVKIKKDAVASCLSSPTACSTRAFGRNYSKFFTTIFSKIETIAYITPASTHNTMVQVITRSNLKTCEP